ncbi:MAG: ECF transporter S component [Promethearchaeota archaeon]
MSNQKSELLINNSRSVASLAIFSGLMTLLNVLLIPVPQPIQYIGFAPVLIYVFGVMLKPWRAFLICAIGSVLGQLFASIILGDLATLPVYLAGAFAARGLEGLFISLLEHNLVRKRNSNQKKYNNLEALILIIGGTWEVFGYFFIGGPYFNLAFDVPYEISLLWYLPVFIDLIFVPVALAVIYAARISFQEEYLDGVLFNDYS